MKEIISETLIAMLLLAGAKGLHAQAFNSGSDGSYGPLNITSNTTLNMPPDGIFNCTTINVTSGVTLTFNKNGLNTPVYLLAIGDVMINGVIDVSGGSPNGGSPGVGGPGGFDGGFGGYGGSGPNTGGGDGKGPGGGKANISHAAFATTSPGNTNVYGNVLNIPLIGGSGGAGMDGNPGSGGGGGGGAILVASNTRISIIGIIKADGGTSGYTCGSGGAIRCIAPVVTGAGSLYVRGSAGYYYPWNTVYSSDGRIRIDCTDNYAFRSLYMPGNTTRGSQMFVFPPVVPRLDITQAAGTAIPVGTTDLVTITLPAGSSTNQTITLGAENFTNTVPVRVSVVPENGPSAQYDSVINMANGSPTQTNLIVVIPVGVQTRIYAWTR